MKLEMRTDCISWFSFSVSFMAPPFGIGLSWTEPLLSDHVKINGQASRPWRASIPGARP